MSSIELWLSTEESCHYLENEISQSSFVDPAYSLNPFIYQQLLESGFRRSGNHVYRPQCPNCQACQSTRIAVNQFKANRSQRRTLLKNKALTVNIQRAVFNSEHYALYQRYQQARHGDSSMKDASPTEYMDFLSSKWSDTLFVEFLGNDKLIAVAIIDKLDNALSAVYTFFEPELSYLSLGTFAILWQMHYAKEQQLDWVYLGFWIEKCQKMAYKTQYKPLQIYQQNQWKNYHENMG